MTDYYQIPKCHLDSLIAQAEAMLAHHIEGKRWENATKWEHKLIVLERVRHLAVDYPELDLEKAREEDAKWRWQRLQLTAADYHLHAPTDEYSKRAADELDIVIAECVRDKVSRRKADKRVEEVQLRYRGTGAFEAGPSQIIRELLDWHIGS